MAKRKHKNKSNMTVSMDATYLEFLKLTSYKLTAEEKSKVGISELVRRALEKCYPIPNDQLEMFDGKA